MEKELKELPEKMIYELKEVYLKYSGILDEGKIPRNKQAEFFLNVFSDNISILLVWCGTNEEILNKIMPLFNEMIAKKFKYYSREITQNAYLRNE